MKETVVKIEAVVLAAGKSMKVAKSEDEKARTQVLPHHQQSIFFPVFSCCRISSKHHRTQRKELNSNPGKARYNCTAAERFSFREVAVSMAIKELTDNMKAKFKVLRQIEVEEHNIFE